MTLELPSELKYGYVTARVIHAVADSAADADDKPEARPAQGKVTFTPAVTNRTTSSHYDSFVIQGTETFNLATQQDIDIVQARIDSPEDRPSSDLLLPFLGEIVDNDSRPGVWLVEGRYRVTFSIQGEGSIPGFDIQVTPDYSRDNPLDLAVVSPVVPSPDVSLISLHVPPGGLPNQALGRDDHGNLVWKDLDKIDSDELRDAIQAYLDENPISVTMEDVETAIEEHINDPNPHPAYDVDIPRLDLIFENGLI